MTRSTVLTLAVFAALLGATPSARADVAPDPTTTPTAEPTPETGGCSTHGHATPPLGALAALTALGLVAALRRSR